jgi:glycosyltransferase involved in cell wall biosynthesis
MGTMPKRGERSGERNQILFFIHSLSSGGAERVTATLSNYWAAKGHQVTVVTITNSTSDFYQLDPRVTRVALDMATESRGSFQAAANNMRRTRALYRVLRTAKPDIAIAMMPTANVTLAIAGRIAGVPTIGSERVYPPATPLGRFWETARRRAYPLLSGLVAQTTDSAAWLRAHAPARRIVAIPNPVNYPISIQPPQICLNSVHVTLTGQRLLLAVGRLSEQKCFDRLLAAFADIAPRHPEWSLVILGEGGLREALTAQVARLQMDGRVALPGVAGNVGDWFAAADIYVMTSRFEGFPNTLLEALCYGVPSLAVDCMTGPRELIEPEVNGLLVPQDDLAALVAGLDRLMGDSDLRERLAKRAVEARETYAVPRIAEQWQAFISDIRKQDAK